MGISRSDIVQWRLSERQKVRIDVGRRTVVLNPHEKFICRLVTVSTIVSFVYRCAFAVNGAGASGHARPYACHFPDDFRHGSLCGDHVGGGLAGGYGLVCLPLACEMRINRRALFPERRMKL